MMGDTRSSNYGSHDYHRLHTLWAGLSKFTYEFQGAFQGNSERPAAEA